MSKLTEMQKKPQPKTPQNPPNNQSKPTKKNPCIADANKKLNFPYILDLNILKYR